MVLKGKAKGEAQEKEDPMVGEKWVLIHALATSFRRATADGGLTAPCNIRFQDQICDVVARPPRQEKLKMLILKGLCLLASTC